MRFSSRGNPVGIDGRSSSLFVSRYDDVLGYCIRRTGRAEADGIPFDDVPQALTPRLAGVSSILQTSQQARHPRGSSTADRSDISTG